MSTKTIGRFGTAPVFFTAISTISGAILSADADLAVVGFRGEMLRHEGSKLLAGNAGLGNTLFASSRCDKTGRLKRSHSKR